MGIKMNFGDQDNPFLANNRQQAHPEPNTQQTDNNNFNQNSSHPFGNQPNRWHNLNQTNHGINPQPPQFNNYSNQQFNQSPGHQPSFGTQNQNPAFGQSQIINQQHFNTPVRIPNKKVITMFAILFAILAIFGGFGYYNGYRTSTYAKFVRETWDKKHEEMRVGSYIYFGSPEKFEEVGTTIKEPSDAAITIFKNKKAPIRAKSIEKDLIEYFETTSKIGDQMIVYANVSKEYDDVYKSLSKISGLSSTSNPEKTISSLGEAKKTVSAAKSKLADISIPKEMDSLKKMNQNFIEALGSLESALEKTINGHKKQDIKLINAAISDFNKTINSLNSALRENDKVGREIVNDFNDKNKRMREIEKNINEFVKEYEKEKFLL